MKSLKFLIAALVIAAAPVFAKTTEINTAGLSENQITELKIQALKAQQSQNPNSVVQEATKASITARTEAEKWADFGKNIGSALVSTAKELGVAAVDFSKTDLGRIATFIIVYKLVGNDIAHFVVGFILLFSLPTLIIVTGRYIILKEAIYEYQDWNFLGLIPYKKKVMIRFEKVNDEYSFWIFFWTFVLTLISVFFSLWFMFK